GLHPTPTLTCLTVALSACLTLAQSKGLVSTDLARFRAVGEVALSPDGHRIAYTVEMFDRPGRPYSQVWVMDLATQKAARIGGPTDATSSPQWSSDSRSLAYMGNDGQKSGLMVAHADGSGASFVAEVTGTNAPIPDQGNQLTWSPDSTQIAVIKVAPGRAARLVRDP